MKRKIKVRWRQNHEFISHTDAAFKGNGSYGGNLFPDPSVFTASWTCHCFWQDVQTVCDKDGQ
jgi:hypothetical protein